jgi:hypothetical protein
MQILAKAIIGSPVPRRGRGDTVARPDYFSLLDHPNFENPASDVSTPVTVGKITALSVNARIMQGGLELEF